MWDGSFAICVEKNAELAEDNPAGKYKGRVVFKANQVKDENWEVAMFQELSSSPATMEASKVADCYGIAPGHVVEQADAEQAYTQSFFLKKKKRKLGGRGLSLNDGSACRVTNGPKHGKSMKTQFVLWSWPCTATQIQVDIGNTIVRRIS